MDPDGGGRGWEFVAESVFSRHWTCSAFPTRRSGFLCRTWGGHKIKRSFILSAERKGWAGLESYQEN